MNTYRIIPLQYAEVFMLMQKTIDKRIELLNGNNVIKWSIGYDLRNIKEFTLRPFFETEYGAYEITPTNVGPGGYAPPHHLRKYLDLLPRGDIRIPQRIRCTVAPYWHSCKYGMVLDRNDNLKSWMIVYPTNRHDEHDSLRSLVKIGMKKHKWCESVSYINSQIRIAKTLMDFDIMASTQPERANALRKMFIEEEKDKERTEQFAWIMRPLPSRAGKKENTGEAGADGNIVNFKDAAR